MAIFHLSVKTVSRSEGRSAVAAAAYRTGTCLYDERCGLEHDYTRKGGITETFTLAPEGAAWALDRSALWNAAEKAETRKNSTVAREYELALPTELSDARRSELVRAFGLELVGRYGVAVDVGIHAPERKGDQRNWHAHVLTTTRVAGPDGFAEKTRVLDAKATGPGEVEALRASWADHINRALEQEQSAERVDHRSYERRGVEQIPTTHLGPLVAAMERRALKEQGLEPKGATGLLEAMSQPKFEPVTERGRGNIMVRTGNALREWVVKQEKALGRGIEKLVGLAAPALGAAAKLFERDRQAAEPPKPSVSEGAMRQAHLWLGPDASEASLLEWALGVQEGVKRLEKEQAEQKLAGKIVPAQPSPTRPVPAHLEAAVSPEVHSWISSQNRGQTRLSYRLLTPGDAGKAHYNGQARLPQGGALLLFLKEGEVLVKSATSAEAEKARTWRFMGEIQLDQSGRAIGRAQGRDRGLEL